MSSPIKRDGGDGGRWRSHSTERLFDSLEAVHRLDAAKLYRLALEKGSAGARYNAVGEEGIPLREIAEAIGRGLKIPVVAKSPEEAGAHFGWLAMFAGADVPASSALTQERLGWHPAGVGLISDLDHARDFES